MSARSGTDDVSTKEERAMVEGRCELHDEDHDGYHVLRIDPSFQESEQGFLGDSFYVERCLQKVPAERCA